MFSFKKIAISGHRLRSGVVRERDGAGVRGVRETVFLQGRHATLLRRLPRGTTNVIVLGHMCICVVHNFDILICGYILVLDVSLFTGAGASVSVSASCQLPLPGLLHDERKRVRVVP